jgi:acetate kinase
MSVSSPEKLGTNSPPRILTINGGSSSVKFALFDAADPATRKLSGRIERIGLPDSWLIVDPGGEQAAEDVEVDVPDHAAAARLIIERLGMAAIDVVGHRIVHGGGKFHRPERVTPELLDELRRICPYDPDHLPNEIALIEAFAANKSDRPQVACFDTAFHDDLPRVAQIMPIPRRYEAAGVRRYGFHGLSFAYLMEELTRLGAGSGRVILAHLGNGASLAAVREGRCIDTTMGFTPAAGLVMGTRSGDLDPGLVAFLARTEGMNADAFDDLVNHQSGLLGVSETSPDFRDLLASAPGDIRAAEAVDLFCYRVKKGIGAFGAALGGLDTLVFAGGIGENSPEARRRICEGLECFGIVLDDSRNQANSAIISAADAWTAVRVIRTDEESMIARAAAEFLPRSAPA